MSQTPNVTESYEQAASAESDSGCPDNRTPINVGATERNISLAIGVAMGIAGLGKPLTLRGLVELGLGAALIHRGITGRCKLYEAIGMNTASTGDEPSAEPHEYFERSIHVQERVTINKPAGELYQFWRKLENLPTFMQHVKEVKITGEGRSHWVAKGPMDVGVEWDAEIINDEADRLIAWRSIGDAEVDNSGSVRFLDAGNGATEMQVTLDYIPPAGQVGAIVAKLFGEEPSQTVKEDLCRFKKIMESGVSAA